MILAAYNSGYNKNVSTTTQALGSSIMANLQELGIKAKVFGLELCMMKGTKRRKRQIITQL